MKSQKLTVKEITELQPTAVQYAAERATVLGGIEVSGDIYHNEVELLVKSLFGATAKLDEAEPCDGNDCVHFVVVDGDYSEYTTTVHSAPENFGDCTDEQAEKIVEKLKKMIPEQFPGIQIRINPCYGGCGSMADATHNSDGDTDDTCEEIDAWISENWENALAIN